jgi:hypothetical protein
LKRRRAAVQALWLVLALALCGCGSGKSSTAPAAVEPTLASIQAQVFASGCAISSCHGSVGQRGGLVLEEGRSYAQLVGVLAQNDAARAKGKLRVAPGHPEQSFLIDKLTAPGSGEGDAMPYTGAALPAEQIEAIRTWIKQGAAP